MTEMQIVKIKPYFVIRLRGTDLYFTGEDVQSYSDDISEAMKFPEISQAACYRDSKVDEICQVVNGVVQ